MLIVRLRRLRLDRHGPAGPRAGDLAARTGVRRSGPGQRRRARAHALPATAAEPLGADPGVVLAGGAGVHHRRGGAVASSASACLEPTPSFGRMIYRSIWLPADRPGVRLLPRRHDLRAGARLQPLRRRAARRARPEVVPVGVRHARFLLEAVPRRRCSTLFAVSVLDLPDVLRAAARPGHRHVPEELQRRSGWSGSATSWACSDPQDRAVRQLHEGHLHRSGPGQRPGRPVRRAVPGLLVRQQRGGHRHHRPGAAGDAEHRASRRRSSGWCSASASAWSRRCAGARCWTGSRSASR